VAGDLKEKATPTAKEGHTFFIDAQDDGRALFISAQDEGTSSSSAAKKKPSARSP
jgi:hypothetical protein